MKAVVVRSVVSISALALVAVGAVMVAPATSAPPQPTGSLVYSVAAVGGGLPALSLHRLDLATNADTELPGSTLDNALDGRTSVSPDGKHVAVTSAAGSGFADDLDVFDIDTQVWHHGLAFAADNGLGPSAWLPDSQHMLVWIPDVSAAAFWIVGLDGSKTVVPGSSTHNGQYYAVSPSGDQIAFSQLVKNAWQVFVMNIDGTSVTSLGVAGRVHAWTHDGSRILLTEDLFASDGSRAGNVVRSVSPRGGSTVAYPLTYTPTFDYRVGLSPDDSWLSLESQNVPDQSATHVDVVPLAGGAAPQRVLSSDSVDFGASWLGAWTATDATAPTMTAVTGVLGASSATLSWPAIDAADTAAVQVALSPGLTPPATYAAGTKRVAVLGAVRSATFTGLTAGATYSYAAWAVDGAGNRSVPVTGHLRLVPAATLTAPALASSTSATGLRVTVTGGGGATAGVRIGWSSISNWVGTGLVHLDIASQSGSVTLRAGQEIPAGSTVRLRAGGLDAYGNVRWSSTVVTSALPYDDRDPLLRYGGTWAKATTTGAWSGTTSVTNAGGSVSVSARRWSSTAFPRRFTVVATTSTSGGRFRVYVDGRYLTTVSTRTTTTKLRRAVYTTPLLSRAAHRLVLVQVSGSGAVRLDGIAAPLTA